MSGKTRFLFQMLKDGMLFEPTRIIWVYGEWQSIYDEATNLFPIIEFEKEMSPPLYDSINPQDRNLVILDDKMNDEGGSRTLAKMFTQGAHHRNLTVIFVLQNMFHQDSSMRTISLNSHYLILFKNPRDKSQIRALGSQMYPGESGFLVSSYQDATKDRFGYLLLDLHPDTHEHLRVRTGILSSDEPYVYLPHKYIKGKK